jgi:hypothetical protein
MGIIFIYFFYNYNYKSGSIEHGWLDGVSIVVAILIIVIVGSGNNYMKEK